MIIIIKGIGTDMVLISRIEKSIETERFLKKYFTENELLLFNKNKKSETIAANFAAKEAISKCFGTGILGFSLNEIEILRDNKGKPFANFFGNAEEIKNNLKIDKVHISITHDGGYALCFAVAEGE